jgi:DASS family divalent anion:Na+ symporter
MGGGAAVGVADAGVPRSAPPSAPLHVGRLALVAGVGVAIWLLPRPEGVEPRAWQLLAIFVATIIGIIAKPLPIGAMAFVGLAATLATRTLTIAEALSGFGNVTLWLVVASFFLAAGFIRTGLGERIAYHIVARFGRSTLGLGYSLVASDLVLAPMIPSNTARAGGVVFPILQSLTKAMPAMDPAVSARVRAFLTLAAYNATVVTGAMFLTAMVANPLIVQFAADQDIVITWGLWALAASVPGVASLIIVPLVIYAMCVRTRVLTEEAPALARAALARMGPVTSSERVMAIVAIVLLAAWIAGTWTGMDPTAAALMAVAVLILSGVLRWEDLAREAEAWNTFIWFAVLVMMATFLGQLGLIKWFTGAVQPAFEGLGWITGFLGIVVVYFYTHYFFASLTAHVSAMYAPFLAVALNIGVPPLFGALVLAFCSNLFACLTHYGTAPAPILFSSGNVPLGLWWRVGAIISLVHMVIWIGIGGVWWRVLGLW